MFGIIDLVLRLLFNGCICCSLNCLELVFIVKLFCINMEIFFKINVILIFFYFIFIIYFRDV